MGAFPRHEDRPLCKVVGSIPHQKPNSWELSLECGNSITRPMYWDGATPGQRRRKPRPVAEARPPPKRARCDLCASLLGMNDDIENAPAVESGEDMAMRKSGFAPADTFSRAKAGQVRTFSRTVVCQDGRHEQCPSGARCSCACHAPIG